MGKKSTKRYSPKFKFTVVLEMLKSEKSDAEVARAFDVHPATLSRWKQAFLEKAQRCSGAQGRPSGRLGTKPSELNSPSPLRTRGGSIRGAGRAERDGAKVPMEGLGGPGLAGLRASMRVRHFT